MTANMEPKFILKLTPLDQFSDTYKLYLYDKSYNFIRAIQTTLEKAKELNLVTISALDIFNNSPCATLEYHRQVT